MPVGSSRVDNPLFNSNQSNQSAFAEALKKQGTLPGTTGSDILNLRELPSGMGSASPDQQHKQNPERRLSIGSAFSGRASMVMAQAANDSHLLGTKRPRPHKIWKKKYIKVMVIGDSGLGKTTLIKSLMSTPGERLQVHDGSYTPMEQFLRDPESLCSTISWRDEEDRVVWVYKIQDTPGYGDDLNVDRTIANLISYIEDQNAKWLEMEQARDRKEDMGEVEDPRVDLCIFAIPPHRLRALDLKVMAEVGKHVPLVPVVTKADTMTIREAATYRNDVANKLSNPMVPGIREKINVFHFERDTLERAGITDHATPIPPFLVVASNEVSEELITGDPPVFWPERRYPWGTAEAFNREHSDLLGLRALLLKEALEEVSKSKRNRYESWRRRALGGIKVGRRVRHVLMWTIIPAVVALQIGRRGVNMDQVRGAVSRTVNAARHRIPWHRLVGRGGEAPAPPAPAPAPQQPKKQFGLF